jgi:hypothetical protein
LIFSSRRSYFSRITVFHKVWAKVLGVKRFKYVVGSSKLPTLTLLDKIAIINTNINSTNSQWYCYILVYILIMMSIEPLKSITAEISTCSVLHVCSWYLSQRLVSNTNSIGLFCSSFLTLQYNIYQLRESVEKW